MATCSLTTLSTDACTNLFMQAAQDEVLFRALLLQLACNMSEGGAGLQCGNYASGQPTFTPGGACGIAVDTSNDALWVYRNGVWTEFIIGA